MTNDKDSAVLPETYEQIHKQALDRKGRPVKSDIGVPVKDENPEYTKLLNEVITLRWKCGDQAAELAALRQPTQSDALLEYYGGYHNASGEPLERFIIPAPKPDPLVEAMADCGVDRFESWADQLRAALDARGFEIREKGQ